MRKVFFKGFMMAALGLGQSFAQTVPAPTASPILGFSGYVDADFATSFAGGGFKDPAHLTGLEIDLTTTVTFSPKLNAVIYTTMNDGIVPAQGAGRTWDDVNFDGVTLNWLYDDKTTIFVGDIIHGTGYFNYYGNKRSAVVVGEHAVRGAGFAREGFTLSTGVTGLGAVDTAGNPVPSSQWATFIKYDLPLGSKGENGTVTPSAKYTAGVPGATPFVAGVSYDGKFGALGLSADIAADYYNGDYDPGFTLLVEPAYGSGKFSVAGTVFYNKKGKNSAGMVSPSAPATTLPVDAGAGSALPPKNFDDLLLYVEPGITLSETYALGLPLEYHDPDLDLTKNETIAVLPTFYVYPGSGVQWWLWAGVTLPTAPASDPSYSAGSEIIFKF